MECSRSLASAIQPYAYSLSSIHILLSLTAILGNSLILVALSKESSLHPPSKVLYRCLATTDLLVGLIVHPLAIIHWMSFIHEDWDRCRWTNHAIFIAGYTLFSVSLLTMTAISADRLLALLLGFRYRQIVTVKRIHVISVFFWIIVSGVFALCQSLIYHITCWYGFVVTAFCLMISSASYTKIFRALSRHQTQIQDHGQQHPSQPNALNIARYRKAVYSALWVQLALFVCYLPYCIVVILTAFIKISQTHLAVSGTLTLILVSFNSTLNPFLYCWKISEVRQAVKHTMRQALCCL